MGGLIAFFAGPIGRWVVIGLLVSAAVAAAGMRAYNAGYAKHEAETTAAIAEANQRARKAESVAAERMAQLVADHTKDNINAKQKIDRLRIDLRNGTRRLSVLASVPTCSDTAASGGPGAETRTELDPATADALVAITAAGDNAIRQSNALIDAYAIAVEVCGK